MRWRRRRRPHRHGRPACPRRAPWPCCPRARSRTARLTSCSSFTGSSSPRSGRSRRRRRPPTPRRRSAFRWPSRRSREASSTRATWAGSASISARVRPSSPPRVRWPKRSPARRRPRGPRRDRCRRPRPARGQEGVSRMRFPRGVTVTVGLLLLAASPASPQSVLRIGLNDDPDALDPTISRAYVGRLVFAAFCDKLFDVTPDLKIVPQLATGYEWGAGGRSVVIRLRPGVKFHDGEPFNAEAVRFNIERHLSTPGSFRKSEIGEIKTVDIVNDLTVRFNLAEPLVPLIAALTDRSGMMVSPKAARELGDKFGTRPVCAGPFKFVERVAQGKIVGERFAEYWDKANIHVDRIEFVPITDSTARLANLRSGDLQMIERVSPTDLAQVRADGKLKVVGIAELGYQMLPLNLNNGPRGKVLGADPRIRQAIDLAIDRATIIKTAFNNEYLPGNQFVSPVSPFYNATPPMKPRDV